MTRIRDRETADCSSVQASEFGNFQETWDWIECESKSFPGKLYFFNLRSLCSTWQRPVASNVQLHRFKNIPRINDNNATSGVENNLLMIVSSESGKENENCNKDKGIGKTSSVEDNNREGAKIYESIDSEVTMSDCLQIKLHGNQVINVSTNECPVKKKNLSSNEKSVVYVSSDEEKENDDVQNRMVVNHLLNPRRLLPRKRKIPQKIVCEMYGTKTVSYDDVGPELPPGVKSTKLSDSSQNSSLWQAEEPKAVAWNNLEIPNVNATVDLSSNSSKSSNSSESSGSSGSSESSESSESSGSSGSSKSSESSKSRSNGCSCDHCLTSSTTSDASSDSISSSEKSI